MPRETHSWTKIYDSNGNIYDSIDDVPVGVTTTTTVVTSSTWTCRRCGRAFPKEELTNDLCTDGNRYGGVGCYDEDEEGEPGEED